MIAKSARPIPSQGAFRAALAHTVFAALLVLLSDRAQGLLFREPEALVQASMVKGWAFVAVTTLLLYVLVGRLVDQRNASYRR